MQLPKLFVLEHNFLEVFKRDHHWVNLAKFAQLKEFNSGDPLAVSREVHEN